MARRDAPPVPIWFHWNGAEIVLGTPPDSAKMRALVNGTRVAVSVDTDTMPYRVLQVRGVVRTDVVDGIAPEYEAITIAAFGEEAGRAWLAQMGQCARGWRRIHQPGVGRHPGLETRFPSALERAMAGATQG